MTLIIRHANAYAVTGLAVNRIDMYLLCSQTMIPSSALSDLVKHLEVTPFNMPQFGKIWFFHGCLKV